MSFPTFQPKDPAYAERVRASFARQAAMETIGASLAAVEPGRVAIEMAWAQPLTQQHGFLHAGMVATALDSACGYAAFSLMPADAAEQRGGSGGYVHGVALCRMEDGEASVLVDVYVNVNYACWRKHCPRGVKGSFAT